MGFFQYVPPYCSGIPRTFLEHSSHTWEKKKGSLKIKNTSPKLSNAAHVALDIPRS